MAESTIQRKITDPEYATQSFSATAYFSRSNPETVSIDVTKSGYTPVGIVSTTSSNSGSGFGVFKNVTLNGNTASCKGGFYLYKQSGGDWVITSASATVTVTVKYIKNN